MKKYLAISLIVFAPSLLMNCNSNSPKEQITGPSKVELKNEAGSFTLYVNGTPFFIKGAGLEEGNIEELANRGGNSLRTWRSDNPSANGIQILDEAQSHGIMVCMGIEVGRERHGFDYNDTVAVRNQLEYVRGEVMKYKDHPALLAWGIGNELNLGYSNPFVWDAVNEIADMIHSIDPYHPVTTMLAGAQKELLSVVTERCLSLDFLSFQLYGDIVNLPRYIEESGYEGAFIVSEWGATGHWEVAKTEWGRPIEQTSHEKALAYQERYENVIASNAEQCIGSFVFLWGQKQERTPTWYGLFLENGEHTESMDVMQYLWTGQWPENRSPLLKSFLLDGKSAYDNVTLVPGQTCKASAVVEEPDEDNLSYRWEIIPEVPENMQSEGGDFEQRPQTVLKMESKETMITFTAPDEPGEYRLFVYASDGHNNAATANIPFLVKE